MPILLTTMTSTRRLMIMNDNFLKVLKMIGPHDVYSSDDDFKDFNPATDDKGEFIESAKNAVTVGSGQSRSLKRNAVDAYSSDDEDFNPQAVVALKPRRIPFQGSEATRRASLPHNLNILAIT